MLRRSGSRIILPSLAARSGASRSPTGWSPAGSTSIPMTMSRSASCTRTATCARRSTRVPRPARISGRCGSRALTGVDRGRAGVVVSLEDGRKLHAPLLVAADGRNSRTREAAGINVARWKYDHQAIVSVLRHERPHEHVAYEIFYPTGPFALLPMNDDAVGHRSAIVWSVPNEDAAGWLSLNDEDFAAEARGGDGWLPRQGRDACAALVLPTRLPPCGADHRAAAGARRRCRARDPSRLPGRASISASATLRHLREVLVEGARLGLDLGDRQLLDRYQRWRSLDALSVAFATDTLTRLYGVPRQDRVGNSPLRHGRGRPHFAAPRPADERSARHQRRAAAAASRTSDLITESSARPRLRR